MNVMSDDEKDKSWVAHHRPTHTEITEDHIHNEGLKDGGAQAHLGYIPKNSQTSDAKNPFSEREKKKDENWKLIKHLRLIEDDLRDMMDELDKLYAEINYRKETINLLERARRDNDLDTAKQIMVNRCRECMDGLSDTQVWNRVEGQIGKEKITVELLEQRATDLEERIQNKIDENPDLDAELRQEFSEKLKELEQYGLDGGLSRNEVQIALDNVRDRHDNLTDTDDSLTDNSHRDGQKTNYTEAKMLEEESPFASAGNVTSPFNQAAEGIAISESNPNSSQQPNAPTDVPTLG